MAELSDLSLSLRLFVAAYRWRRIDPVPCAVLRKPLRDAKVALVSTAGLVLPGQEPFDESVKGGDSSLREIAHDSDPSSMIDTHRSGSYDHSGVHADANLAFPLDRLRELARDGAIGSANQRHFSLMGSITAPRRLCDETAPRIADAFAADGVDAVVLVPV